MSYQRQIKHFDRIVEIQPVSDADFYSAEFKVKVEKMADAALKEIDSMVTRAKKKLGLIPLPLPPREDPVKHFGYALAAQQQALHNPLWQINQLGRQQQGSGTYGGLLGGRGMFG